MLKEYRVKDDRDTASQKMLKEYRVRMIVTLLARSALALKKPPPFSLSDLDDIEFFLNE